MKIVKQIIEALAILLPFFKRKDPKALQEFSDLLKGQYTYLMELVEKFQNDYFTLSERVARLYEEINRLNDSLSEALKRKCHLFAEGSADVRPCASTLPHTPLP